MSTAAGRITSGRRSVAATRSMAVAGSVPWLVVLVGAAAGFVWIVAMLSARGDGLATQAFDLAFFQQVVWNASRGDGFVSSFSGGSFLGLHFSPLLAVPAVLELAWQDARLLTVLHAIALAASAPAAFLFLRALLRPARSAAWVAAGLAAVLPVSAAVQQAARADFHTDALALPLALLAGWAGLGRRTGAFIALAVLALLAKEDQGFTVFVLGLVVAARAHGRLWRGGAPWRGGRPVPGTRLAGAALAVIGALWVPLTFGVLMPLLRGDARLETDWYYAWLTENGGPLAQLPTIRDALLNPDGWMALAGIILSLALLPLLAVRWLPLLLLPVLANLLSANGAQHDILLHYTLLLLFPAIAFAGLGGRHLMAWAARRTRRRSPAPAGRRPIILLLAVPALVVAVVGGSLPPGANAVNSLFSKPAARAELRAIAASVPADATLVVDDMLAVPLASRAHLRLIATYDDTAYVLVDRRAILPGYASRGRRERFIADVTSSQRPVLADDGRFILYGPEP